MCVASLAKLALSPKLTRRLIILGLAGSVYAMRPAGTAFTVMGTTCLGVGCVEYEDVGNNDEKLHVPGVGLLSREHLRVQKHAASIYHNKH